MGKKLFKTATWLTSILMLVVTLFTLTACAKSDITNAVKEEPKSTAGAKEEKPAEAGADEKPIVLKMITWVQQSNEDAIKELNDAFTGKYPNISIVVDTVGANDYSTLQNTRIAAGDVDIVTTNGPFDLYPPDYTKGCELPAWATHVENGSYLDITNEPFIANWDPNMIKNAVTFKGKVYGLDVGTVGFNGLFYNKKLFEENGFKEPGTWAEFVEICKTLKAKGISPITLGMKDGWPLDAIAVSGIVGANEADMNEFVKGLWTGTRKFTDEKTMKIWNRMAEFVSFLEPNVQAVTYGDAPGRLVAGKAAMLYDGTWNAGAIAGLDPNFTFGYFPVPGDIDAKPNQLQGKYDLQFNIAARTAYKDACLKWMDFLSQKENYTPFVNKLGFFPTMPGVVTSNEFVNSLAEKNKNFGLAFERYMIAPKGVGKYAVGQGFVLSQLKAVGGTVEDVATLAELAQKDWDEALAAAK